MKLSIIIPVYNAEQFLTKCLESICHQELDPSEYEVVLINDGSTDRSLNLAEDFRLKIKNFTIVTHENQGEAASRNIALQIAKGEYITFLDSDDYYEDKALSVALELIARDHLDILYLRLRQVDENGGFLGYVHDLPDAGVVSRGLDSYRRPFPATVYRRVLIGDIIFPAGIIVGPDSVFNAMVHAKAERVSFTREAAYNYTYRPDSLSKQGYTQKGFIGFMKALSLIHTYQQQYFEKPDAENYFDRLYEIFVTRILELNVMPEWNRDRYNGMVKLLEEKDLRYILTKLAVKYPYADTSYPKFKAYQQYLALKSDLYKFIRRA